MGIRLKAGRRGSRGVDQEPMATAETDDWARTVVAMTGRSRWNQEMFWENQ